MSFGWQKETLILGASSNKEQKNVTTDLPLCQERGYYCFIKLWLIVFQ